MRKTLLLSLVVLAAVAAVTVDGAKKPKMAKPPKMMTFRKVSDDPMFRAEEFSSGREKLLWSYSLPVIRNLWRTCNKAAMMKGPHNERQIWLELHGKIFDVCVDVLALSPDTADLHQLLVDLNSDQGMSVFARLRGANITSSSSEAVGISATTEKPQKATKKKTSSKKKTASKKKKTSSKKKTASKKKKTSSKKKKLQKKKPTSNIGKGGSTKGTTADPLENVGGVTANPTDPTTVVAG